MGQSDQAPQPQRGRKRRPQRRWSNPTSPLQAARFARQQTGQEVVDAVRELCPGHGGQPCRLDATKISDYETGGRRPGRSHIEALCTYYQQSPEALGLITWRGQPAQQSTSEDLLLGLLAINLGTEQPNPARHHTSQAPTSTGALGDLLMVLARHDQQRLATTTLSAEQLTRLHQAADEHARGYYQLTILARMGALITDWVTTRSLLDLPQTPSQRIQLTHTYARLTGILGSLAFDHGHPDRARTLLETAQDAAREAGDTDLQGWTLEQRGMLSDWHDDPEQTIALTGRGLEVIGTTSTPTAARLHARAATAHATLDDHRAVTTHLDAAERILASPAGGCWPTAPAMPRAFSFTPDALTAATGKSHLRLGHHPTAVERCQQATVLQHEHGLSARTALAVQLNQLHLASALLHTGELDQAQQVAMVSIQDYQGVAMPLLLRRAHELSHDLSAADPGSSRGRAFTEFLHDHATRARRHG